MTKEKLFSVTAKDCEWEYFRGTGNGGQKKNKTSNCARCRHLPSGAVGEGREGRSQLHNRQLAFKRMAESKEFQVWARMEAARVTGRLAEIEKEVERQMKSTSIVVEMKKDGKWVPYEESENVGNG